MLTIRVQKDLIVMKQWVEPMVTEDAKPRQWVDKHARHGILRLLMLINMQMQKEVQMELITTAVIQIILQVFGALRLILI